MITNYKNAAEILEASKPISAKRLNEKDQKLVQTETIGVDFGKKPGDVLELHVYDLDGNRLTSNHNVSDWSAQTPERYQDKASTDKIFVDVHKNIRDLGFQRGKYKFVYNFHRDVIGSRNSVNKLYVREISGTRSEVQLKATNDTDNSLFNFGALNDYVRSASGYFMQAVLNFGDNKTVPLNTFTRNVVSGQRVYCKLYDPLPDDITEKDICWISIEVKQPYVDNILVIPEVRQAPNNTLKDANFDISTDFGLSTETDFKNWNELLGSGLSTSQQIIDDYFSGSLSGINLGIDYSNFDNFIHFSSATERVKNFRYKMELLEFYNGRLSTLGVTSGSTQSSITEATYKRDEVISGFDGFEKYLFYGTSGSLFTHALTGSVDAWPKTPINPNLLYNGTFEESFTNWDILKLDVTDSGVRPAEEHEYEISAENNRLKIVNKSPGTLSYWIQFDLGSNIISGQDYEFGYDILDVSGELADFALYQLGFVADSAYANTFTNEGTSSYTVTQSGVLTSPYVRFRVENGEKDSFASVGNMYVKLANQPTHNSHYSVSSSIALNYFSNLVELAELYDTQNDSILRKAIPENIQIDQFNDEFSLFVDMLGHHFDINWTYINNLTSVHNKDEHPNYGIPDDLLFDVAKSMGWNLQNGHQLKDLWKYTLGTNQNGDTWVNNGLEVKSSKDLTKEVWRRIVNNLPYILKTKGTDRSVKALMSCYGIPSTLLTIKEYGGPKTTSESPKLIHDKFHYVLDLDGTNHIKNHFGPTYTQPAGISQIPNQRYNLNPNTIELNVYPLDIARFEYSGYGTHTIMQVGSGSDTKVAVTIEPTGSAGGANVHLYLSGSLGYKSASVNDVCILDGELFNLAVTRKFSNTNVISNGDFSSNNTWLQDPIYSTPVTVSLDGEARLNVPSGSSVLIKTTDKPLDQNTFYSVTADIKTNISSKLNQGYPAFHYDGSGAGGINQIYGTGIHTSILKGSGAGPVSFGFGTPVAPSQIDSEVVYDNIVVRNIDQIKNDIEYELIIQKSKYGKIIVDVSSSISVLAASQSAGDIVSQSYNMSWGSASNDLYIGLGDNPFNNTNFTGSISELRYYNVPLSASILQMHAQSPESFNSNNSINTFDDLKYRITFEKDREWSPLSNQQLGNVYTSSTIQSAHPEYGDNTFIDGELKIAYGVAFSQSNVETSYRGIEEKYYTSYPSVGGNNPYSEKIRIEDNELIHPLSLTNRSERSTFDRHPTDSARLGIYFSPSDIVNRDIAYHLGGISLDNYIGNPNDLYETEYSDLNNLATEYWKKYENKNDIASYIRMFSVFDFTLFKQIEQLLPGRVDKILGLVIEPNHLERNKQQHRRPSGFDLDQAGTVDGTILSSGSGEFLDYSSSIIMTMGPSSSVYEYNNLILNTIDTGSIYITSSSPYWESRAVQVFVSGARPSNHRLLAESPPIVTTDFYYPATMSQFDASDFTWSNAENAQIVDETFAMTFSTGSGSTWALVASDFGVEIPSGSVIRGIRADIKRKANHMEADRYIHDINVSVGKTVDATAEGLNLAVQTGSSISIWTPATHSVWVSATWTSASNEDVWGRGAVLPYTHPESHSMDNSGSTFISASVTTDGGEEFTENRWWSWSDLTSSLPYEVGSPNMEILGVHVRTMHSRQPADVIGNAYHFKSHLEFIAKAGFHDSDNYVDSMNSNEIEIFNFAADITPINPLGNEDTLQYTRTNAQEWSMHGADYDGNGDISYNGDTWGIFNPDDGFSSDMLNTLYYYHVTDLRDDPDGDVNLMAANIHDVQARILYRAVTSSFIENAWATENTNKVYGHASQRWGQTWVPEDITGSAFNVYMTAQVSQSAAFVDSMGVQVTYQYPEINEIAQTQDFLPRGIENHRYAGCKMTSPGVGQDSPDTIDGGPVVERIIVNPRTLVTSANSNTNLSNS